MSDALLPNLHDTDSEHGSAFVGCVHCEYAIPVAYWKGPGAMAHAQMVAEDDAKVANDFAIMGDEHYYVGFSLACPVLNDDDGRTIGTAAMLANRTVLDDPELLTDYEGAFSAHVLAHIITMTTDLEWKGPQ